MIIEIDDALLDQHDQDEIRRIAMKAAEILGGKHRAYPASDYGMRELVVMNKATFGVFNYHAKDGIENIRRAVRLAQDAATSCQTMMDLCNLKKCDQSERA